MEETIQGRKLYEKIRYALISFDRKKIAHWAVVAFGKVANGIRI